jgi:hypothetical protein
VKPLRHLKALGITSWICFDRERLWVAEPFMGCDNAQKKSWALAPEVRVLLIGLFSWDGRLLHPFARFWRRVGKL